MPLSPTKNFLTVESEALQPLVDVQISLWPQPTMLTKVKVKVAQLCPTLCDPMDYIVHGILQTTILEWVAFPFFGDLPNSGIEPRSPTPVSSIEGGFFTS